MIEKTYGAYYLRCDRCGESSAGPFEDFYDAVNFKKTHGWKSEKDENGEWEDVCPDCAEGGKAWD